MLSLYLHIPFCRQKCAYCAFYSAPAAAAEKQRYADALCSAVRAAGAEEQRPLSSLYLGGGTPALLGEAALRQVLAAVKESFSLAPDAECTVELNPESTTPSLLAALRAAGINRLSLGIQSLLEKELALLGRIHSRADALAALERIFEAGFTNVSADVMFGLPGQTQAGFAETLDTLLKFPLTHLSAYSLQLEAGTPLGESAEPMEEEAEYQLWQLLCQKARAAGMEHYEISNFAKAGYRSRHNSAYWARTDYIGLGAAAHSFWKGVRYDFPPDREDFCRAPWPLRNPLPIGEAEAREEAVMLGLRTDQGIPCALLPKGFDPLRYQAFSKIEGDRFILNEQGYYVSNRIIAEILTKEQTL